MPLLAVLSILGWAALVCSVTAADLSLCIFATVSGVAGLLYIAGLAGQLSVAAHALFYLGLAAGAATAVTAAMGRGNRNLWRAFLAPGPALFIVGSAAVWLCYNAHTFAWWDEFSHWGSAAKELALTNALRTNGSSLAYQDYPPGSALFYYFFFANGRFDEGVASFAHFVLLCAPLAILFRGLRWRQAHWVGATLLFALLMFSAREYSFLITCVDILIGVYFAMTLVAYLTSEAKATTALLIMPGLFLLPLIKKAGLFFAAVCVAVICVDAVMRFALNRRRGGMRAGPGSGAAGAAPKGRRRLGAAAAAFVWGLAVASPFAAEYSWRHWVDENHLERTFTLREGHSYRSAFRALLGDAAGRERQITSAFVERFRQYPLGSPDTTVYAQAAALTRLGGPVVPRLATEGVTLLFFGFLGASLWLTEAKGQARARLVAAAVVIVISYGLYLVGMLANYLFAFTEYEGLHVSHFDRYAWTYLAGVALVAWAFIAQRGGTESSPVTANRMRKAAAFALSVGLAAYLYCFENTWALVVPPVQGPGDVSFRETLRPELENVRRNTPADSSVYIVYRGTNGIHHWVIAYEIMPRHFNNKNAPLDVVFRNDNKGRGPVTADQAARIVRGYSYVFVAYAGEEFWTLYGRLFDRSQLISDSLFKVETNEAGDVTLVPVREEGRQ